MANEQVGVVTVAYESDAVLHPFLTSIEAATRLDTHVVVVDNKPDQGDARGIAGANGADYIAMDSNRGYGGAVNRGVQALPETIRWVLVSNPDVVLHDRALDILIAAARSADGIGAVGPRILNPDGSVYPSAREIPSIRTGIGHALFGSVWPTNPWSESYRNSHVTRVHRRFAGWLSGSCLLLDRAAFRAIGGFDSDYFMYFEDVDLGMRLAEAGYSSLYEPDAVALHTGAHATTREPRQMVSAHHTSARRFLRRKYPGLLLAPVRWVIELSLRAREFLLTRR